MNGEGGGNLLLNLAEIQWEFLPHLLIFSSLMMRDLRDLLAVCVVLVGLLLSGVESVLSFFIDMIR